MPQVIAVISGKDVAAIYAGVRVDESSPGPSSTGSRRNSSSESIIPTAKSSKKADLAAALIGRVDFKRPHDAI
jgi:hypothetical protein